MGEAHHLRCLPQIASSFIEFPLCFNAVCSTKLQQGVPACV